MNKASLGLWPICKKIAFSRSHSAYSTPPNLGIQINFAIFGISILFLFSSSCLSSQSPRTELKIIGGEITSDRPEIVKIRRRSISGFCTGVFVNPKTMLTSTHCIDTNRTDGDIYLEDRPHIAPIATFFHQNYSKRGCAKRLSSPTFPTRCSAVDLAIVVFAIDIREVTDISNFAEVARQEPQEGSLIEVWGHGRIHLDSNSGKGIKNRARPVLIKSTNDDLFHYESIWNNEGDQQKNHNDEGYHQQFFGLTRGDSGGPVFDEQGKLIGINSGFKTTQTRQWRSFITRINGPSSKWVGRLAFRDRNIPEALRPMRIPGWEP